MKKWEEPNAGGSFNGAGRICCYLKEIIIRFSLLGEKVTLILLLVL